MTKSLRCIVLILACAVLAAAQENPAGLAEAGPRGETAAPAPDGAKLLDLFIINMNEMAKAGTSGTDMDKRLKEMKTAAGQALEAKSIDKPFFARYNRLLAVTKLVAAPDPSGVLGPVFDDIISRFVYDVLGQDFRMGKGPEAIRMVADSLAEEIINLQIYLDTLGKRAALRKRIDSMSSPSK